MEDNKRYDLLYTPELKPDRNYRSEAKFKDKPTPRHYTPPPEEPTIDDHINELRELEELILGLPEDIFPLKDLTAKLKERAEIIKIEDELGEYIPFEGVGPEPGYITTPEEEIDNEIDIGTNINELKLPDNIPLLFPSPSGISVQVETPKTLVQMAQEAYRQDQLDLQKDYIRKMKLLLQNYFTNQLAALYALNGGDINSLTQDFDGEAVKNIPANLQHLADTIIKSQLRRNQKKRFFDKVVNTSQTLEHMRTWNAAEKARERYYEQAYNDSSDYLNSESNALLREARASSDARYRSALYNMYKYLDNGAKITEDILGDMVIEAKAKAKLIKEGIDIFRTTEAAAPKGTGVSAVQAQDSAKLKSLNEAKQKAEKEAEEEAKNGNKNKTPAELDQMYQIEEPASESEWGLSPTGSHWDMKDINDLINSDPNIYTARTNEGKEAIRVALSMTPKYTKVESTNSVNNQTSSSNSKNEQVEKDSKSGVQSFFQQNKDWLIIH